MLQVGVNKLYGTHHVHFTHLFLFLRPFLALGHLCTELLRSLLLAALWRPRLFADGIPTLAFLARLLTARQWFFLAAWRPRVPTFSVSPTIFSEL